ncbi:MAG: hypothetical protein U1F53_22135 [Burkholderiaceae bacterium]
MPRCTPTRARLPRAAMIAAAISAVVALAGCGKVTEVASQKATEKVIESQINKDGGNAKVDLSNGGATVQGTDKDGKSFKMEMGSAQLSEKDVGIPFYPGAKPKEQGGTRIQNDKGQMVSIELTSSDDPKKVAAWYREQLKPRGEGAMVIDSAKDNGMQLSIVNEKSNESLMIDVAGADDGSHITLMHSTNAQ